MSNLNSFMNLAKLRYPKKSHRKIIQYPEKSKELAEFMDIILGDGGINNDWQLTITVNGDADKDYAIYVKKLAKELFNIDAATQRRKETKALVLRFSSMNLLDFLVSKGAVRGNKIKQCIDIPKWICKRASYERAFVRGLVDTDGCLYTHDHNVHGKKYNNLGFCFASCSKNLMRSVSRIFKKNGIKPHITRNMKMLYLYSIGAIESYLDIFGTSNPRIGNKYSIWKGA